MDMRLLWRLTAPLGGAPRDLRLSSGRLPRRRLHLIPPPWGLQAPAYTRRGLPEDRRRGSAGHEDRDPFQSSRQDLATWMCGGLLILQGLALPTPPARARQESGAIRDTPSRTSRLTSGRSSWMPATYWAFGGRSRGERCTSREGRRGGPGQLRRAQRPDARPAAPQRCRIDGAGLVPI